ncbi:MAG: hypothetical protein GX446_07795 [Chthonomonadales bacterium]|nr:hypothetical protein [Chthonomonadales bacterium]
MEIKPPVAIAAIVLVILVAGFLLWRSTGTNRFKPPPPITTGTVMTPGAPPAGQAGTGPQIQTGVQLPSGAGGGQAEYRPGK